MLGGGRLSPALRAAAPPPVPALPIQGTAGSAAPAGGAARAQLPPGGIPRGCAGRGWTVLGGLPIGSIQPCEPPASRPAARGASEPLLSFPPREARTKPELCRLPQHDGTRALCLQGEGQDGWSCSGRSRSQTPAPGRLLGRISALLWDQHVPTWADAVCSVALTAPSTDTTELCRVAGVCPKSGGCHLPRDPGSDKGTVQFRGTESKTSFFLFVVEKNPWADPGQIPAPLLQQ